MVTINNLLRIQSCWRKSVIVLLPIPILSHDPHVHCSPDPRGQGWLGNLIF